MGVGGLSVEPPALLRQPFHFRRQNLPPHLEAAGSVLMMALGYRSPYSLCDRYLSCIFIAVFKTRTFPKDNHAFRYPTLYNCNCEADKGGPLSITQGPQDRAVRNVGERADGQGSNPGSLTCQWCDLGQVT